MEEARERERDELARIVQALSDGRPAYARAIAETATALALRGTRRSHQRACRAPGARRRARADVPLLLRAPPPPRARLRRAQGDPRGALAEEEPLTLTEIALRLHRTPGSTKDYLSWLEDVDLIVSRQKRYSFADPMLRLWVRLHCRAVPPSEDDIARELQSYVLARLPHAEPALALAGHSAGGPREELGHHRDRLVIGLIGVQVTWDPAADARLTLTAPATPSAARAAAWAASFLLRPSACATGSPSTSTSTRNRL